MLGGVAHWPWPSGGQTKDGRFPAVSDAHVIPVPPAPFAPDRKIPAPDRSRGRLLFRARRDRCLHAPGQAPLRSARRAAFALPREEPLWAARELAMRISALLRPAQRTEAR